MGAAAKTGCRPQLGVSLVGCLALIAETGRQNSNDLIDVVVEPQASAQNVRVGSEGPLPQPVADDHLAG